MRPIDYFDTAVESYADRIAFMAGTETMSFRDVDLASRQLAASISRTANSNNRRAVAVYSPNDHRVILCTLACMRAGAVIAPLHAKTSPAKIVEYIRQIEPACLFYHSSMSEEAHAISQSTDAVGEYVCLDGDPSFGRSMESFLASGSDEPADWGDIRGNYEHPVYLRQTSGTTGAPKTIVADVGSFVATHLVLRERLHRVDCDPVCLVAAPLSHAAGVHAFCALTLGARLVILRDFDPLEVLRAIERERVTHVWLTASGLYLLLRALDVESVNLSSLRSVVVGASGVSPNKLQEAAGRLGPCISVNYSQIESGFLTWLDERTIAEAAAGRNPERLASSGRSLYVSRVAIMAENGALLQAGKTGEIVVRGRSVKPYVVKVDTPDDAELATSRRFGWHHTGDLGFIDAHGYLYVVGRTKDTINMGGFKVSADEVERAILELSGVAECAVVAVPDSMRGEAAKAIISLHGGHAMNGHEVIAHCRTRLGPAYAPVSVEFWAELPKSAVGKIDKGRIRELVGRPSCSTSPE